MKTSKVNPAVIALLSISVFLAACSDEQKESTQQAQHTIPEYESAKPVEERVDISAETIDSIIEEESIQLTEEDFLQLDESEPAITDIPTNVKETASYIPDLVKASPEQIKKIQQALLDSGFNPGPVDGLIGSKTMAALKDFQKQNNLTEGKITRETLQALNITEE